MSVCVVYNKKFGVKYKTSICSKAFILFAIITALTFTLPFLFCYRSNGTRVFILKILHVRRPLLWLFSRTLSFSGLWLKHETYREQPRVRFKLQYLLYVETSDPISPLVCGTSPRALDATSAFCPTLKVYAVVLFFVFFSNIIYVSIFRQSVEGDANVDGKNEFLDLELRLTVANETLDVHSIHLLLLFDFKIQVITYNVYFSR